MERKELSKYACSNSDYVIIGNLHKEENQINSAGQFEKFKHKINGFLDQTIQEPILDQALYNEQRIK